MHLDDYLRDRKEKDGTTETDFGVLVGLSQPQVNRIRNDISNPSWATALRISRETDKAVTTSDLGFVED